MKKNLFSLLYFEISGSLLLSILFFVLRLPASYYLIAFIAAIPLGSVLDLIGYIIFKPLREIRFGTTKVENKKPNKSEEMLFMLNIHRSFFVISFISIFFVFITIEYIKWWLPTSIILSILMFIQTIRFEKHFKKNKFQEIKI